MKYRILSKTETELYGANVMTIVDYNDVAALGATTTGAALSVLPATTNGALPAAGTSGTDTIPAGSKVELVGMILDTAFVSGTAAGLVVKVGDGGSTNRFLANTQVQSGQTPISYAVGTVANQPYVYTTADTVDAIFTSTTANLSTFTAGSLRLLFKVNDLNRLPLS